MDICDVKGTDIETYWHGKMNFTVGLCESMGVPDIFNKYLDSECGRVVLCQEKVQVKYELFITTSLLILIN